MFRLKDTLNTLGKFFYVIMGYVQEKYFQGCIFIEWGLLVELFLQTVNELQVFDFDFKPVRAAS
jgi:hypothetical protein